MIVCGYRTYRKRHGQLDLSRDFVQYQYTATVLAIQASVSIKESDALSCRCDLLNICMLQYLSTATKKSQSRRPVTL